MTTKKTCEKYDPQAYTPTLPWRIIQLQVWPWTLAIKSANDLTVMQQDLYSFSTEDKTLEQANRRDGNAEQKKVFEQIIESVNNHDALLQRNVYLKTELQHIAEHHGTCNDLLKYAKDAIKGKVE